MLLIALPTLKRPDAVRSVAKNIEETTHGEAWTLVFGVEGDDVESLEAAHSTGHSVSINRNERSYSGAIQSIYEDFGEGHDFLFTANDDFHFLPDWNRAPVEMLESNPGIHVVGVDDGHPSKRFTGIQMIRLDYIRTQSGVVDIPNRVFYPYRHNYADNEMTETAQNRGVWSYIDAPCVEHRHHSFYGVFDQLMQYDWTYAKSIETVDEDQRTYVSRRHLWS